MDVVGTGHLKEHSFFWTYNPSQAVPVETANCGVLTTRARGDVRMTVQAGDKPVTIVLKDCFHAPDVPLNFFELNTIF